MGKIFVNLIGIWKEGFTQPMWVTPAVLATSLIRREKEDYYAILLSSHNFPGAA